MESIPSIRPPGSPLAAVHGATDWAGNPVNDRNTKTGQMAAMKDAMHAGALGMILKSAASSTPSTTPADVGRLGLAVTRAEDPIGRALAAERLAHATLMNELRRGRGHLGTVRPTSAQQLAAGSEAVAKATTPQGRENAALSALMRAVTSGPPGMPAADPDFKPNGNVAMGVTDTVADILAGISGDSTEPDDELTDPLGGIAYVDRPTGTPRVDPRKLPSVDGVRARGIQRTNATTSDERQAIPSAMDSRLGGVPAPIAKAAATGRRVERAEALRSAGDALGRLAKIIGEHSVAKGAARQAATTPASQPAGRTVTFPLTVSLGG